MLTCTFSMIETSIAIIATCLPALRSVILGTNTTKGDSNGYGKHYELSSARRKAKENRLTVNHDNSGLHTAHRSRVQANGSEDSLFSDRDLQPGGGLATGKIAVNIWIETRFENMQSKEVDTTVQPSFK
jgi:hypothetical protein